MKKKILFIMHLPPPVHGAAMVGQYIMDSKIIRESFQADYINLSTSSNLIDIGRGSMQKVLSLLKIIKTIFVALSTKDHDLCYMTLTATGPGFYKDLVVVFLLKAFRKNIVYHFHNKGVAVASKKKINKVLYRATFKNTQSILLTKNLYIDLVEFVPEKSIYYCANGIPAGFSKTPLKLVSDKILPCKLLFFSNMMQEKGVYILLEACKLLIEKGLEFQCDFVGAWSDVSEKRFDQKVKDQNLQRHVFAHGKKYGREKMAFFNNADIFVLPTYYHNECLPLVLLEAMQQGMAIVSTPEGGIADVIIDGKNGYLTSQRDVLGLAQKLEILITDPDIRSKLGTAARLSFDNCYTLLHFETRLDNILKTLTPSLRDIRTAKKQSPVMLDLS